MGLAPVDVMKNQTIHNLNTQFYFLQPTQNSGSLFTSSSKVSSLCSVNRTMTGLHSQTHSGLHSRQPCLFQSKSRTSTFTRQGCCLPHTINSAHSSVRSSHTWSPIKSKVSLSCHSFRMSDISADSSGSLVISPRRPIQLSWPLPFPSANLISKSFDQAKLKDSHLLPSRPRLSSLVPFRSTSTTAFPPEFSAKSLSRLSDFELLLCIICQIWAPKLFGLPISRFHEYMNSSSSWHNLRSVSEALACASSTFRCISSRSSRAAFSSSFLCGVASRFS